MFTYFKFLDKFHIEPSSWKDLFDYFEYEKTEGKIRTFLSNMGEVK